MTAIVAADVTLTIERRAIEGKPRRNRVKIVFGDSALTYPSGGVPMPGFASWGMKRNLDYLTVFDENDASGVIWKYDTTNNKLRGYAMRNHAHKFVIADGAPSAAGSGALHLSAILGSSDSTLRTLQGSGVSLNTGSPVGSGGGDDTLLIEVSTGYVIVAQTMFAEAVGW